MSRREICSFSVHQLSSYILSSKLSPVEIVEAHLTRIEALNPKLNAFITLCGNKAYEAAKQAEKEMGCGGNRGPLHGIPFGAKDIFDSAGVLTTYGSSFFRENVPIQDAESISRLKKAGAILIGKCNTGEFGTGATTKNPWYGSCRNPWNPSRVPGGSSGGSAAAVAAFLCPAAIGSDTGGSIRGPAALCGAVGLMPTYGRVTLRGMYPNATSLDHVGVIARTVRDCALVFQEMAGYDPLDPNSGDVPVPNFCEEIDRGVRGMRLGVCPDLVRIEIDAVVDKAFENAVDTLRRLGARIKVVSFPPAGKVEEVRRAISDGENIELHRNRFSECPEGYGEYLRERLEKAARLTVDEYVRACREREVMRRSTQELFRSVDAILLPTYPCSAPPIDTLMAEINGRRIPFEWLGVNLTGFANLIGIPALAIPMGFDPDGLPVSMQILSPAWSESRLLRIAHAFEQVTSDIQLRHPPLSRTEGL
jgi:aspartyl-tRNA(Asn)/glutamyl-tRNA(Gln) amidotransferase subunit A